MTCTLAAATGMRTSPGSAREKPATFTVVPDRCSTGGGSGADGAAAADSDSDGAERAAPTVPADSDSDGDGVEGTAPTIATDSVRDAVERGPADVAATRPGTRTPAISAS